MDWITDLFRQLFSEPPADKLASKLLLEAESLALQHHLSAQHHQALADMYLERIQYLKQHRAGFEPVAN